MVRVHLHPFHIFSFSLGKLKQGKVDQVCTVVVFFSFLFENAIASPVVVYLLEVISLIPSMLLGELFEELKKTYILSSVATYETVMKPTDMVPGFVNGKDVYLPVYNWGENVTAIVVSFVLGAVLLTVGYCVFKSRDRK